MLFHLELGVVEIKLINLLLKIWVLFDLLQSICQWLESEEFTEIPLVFLCCFIG